MGLRLALAGTEPEVDTCVDGRCVIRLLIIMVLLAVDEDGDDVVINRKDNTGHRDIKDGPFPWDASIEGLVNSIVRFGST